MAENQMKELADEIDEKMRITLPDALHIRNSIYDDKRKN